MKKNYLLVAIILLMATLSYSQDNVKKSEEVTSEPVKEEFKPSGKAIVQVFTNFHISSGTIENVSVDDGSFTINDNKMAKSFEVTRAYFGYGYNFSEKFSARVILDVGDPGVKTYQMVAFLKNAYLQYTSGKLTTQIGMMGGSQYSLQETYWGSRYIRKTFNDEYGFGPSADIGASIDYKINDFLSVDASLLNGEGYKIIQSDSTIKITMGATVKPIKGLVFRAYYDIINDTSDQQNLSFFAGYNIGKYFMGAEYNYQFNNKFRPDYDYYGFSIFGRGPITTKMNGFIRFDNLSGETLPLATTPWSISKNGQLFIAGVEFSPVKGIRIAPNFQGWQSSQAGAPFLSSIFLNVEFKL